MKRVDLGRGAWAVAAVVGLGCAVACGSDDGGGGAGGGAGSSGSAADSGASGSGAFGGSGGAGAASGSGGIAGAAGASSGGSGGGGTGGSGGAGGSSGGCNDPGPEPNDSLIQATPTCATPPCEIGDCDGDGDSVSGVIAPGDVDFFAFKGNDGIGCQVNATATTQDSGFQLCVFVQCEGGGDTELDSCTSGTLTDGPNGYKGCCVDAPGSAEAAHNCSGISETAGVYIRVDQANACTPYSIDYHF